MELTDEIMVSACLLGENCKYNGGNNYNAAVAEFVKDKDVLPICPEMMAGMGCPRTPIEIVDGVLMDRDGNNVDAAMREAVAKAMERIRKEEIQIFVYVHHQNSIAVVIRSNSRFPTLHFVINLVHYVSLDKRFLSTELLCLI